jgi:UDP-glucose 4-epimerase
MAFYLVTGGAGFIGSHIADALMRRGDRVRVLDNFSTGKHSNIEAIQRDQLEVIEGDIRDMETVCRAMTAVDCVIHQAAAVSVPQSMTDPATTHAINVNSTLNILTAARQFNVKRVVMASSCAVYGDNDALPLKETCAPKPLSPYAATKLIDEVYCQTFARAFGVPTVCLRYFNVYGPRQDPNGDYAAVIPKFAQRLKAGQPPIVNGDGTQTRDFVHVSDVVRANLLASECDEAIGQVFNVASGHGTSLLELIKTFNALGDVDFQPVFAPERAGDIKHSRGDGTFAAARLGFTARMTLAEGLKQFYG